MVRQVFAYERQFAYIDDLTNAIQVAWDPIGSM